MLKAGPRNLITDVSGILVGNAVSERARTGVTVVLPEQPAVAAVDVRGGGPGTRETDSLNPTSLVPKIDAVVLSGGSAFGLDAAGGVMSALVAQGRGFPVAGFRVPIVPAAILFDLANGGDKNWGREPPYRALGEAAIAAVGRDFALGNAGAGLGAKAGRLKGGLGSASAVDETGWQIGALVAANPVGSVVEPAGRRLWAAPFEQANEFGGAANSDARAGRQRDLDLDLPVDGRLGGHTCLGVVATNLALDKAMALRVAMMAHDGLARAIRPAHTPLDGDTIFVLATGVLALPEPTPLALSRLGHIASDCISRAIGRAVFHAESLGDYPGYRTFDPDKA
jgi:L-aminopeptidase/D-esterase-like protein